MDNKKGFIDETIEKVKKEKEKIKLDTAYRIIEFIKKEIERELEKNVKPIVIEELISLGFDPNNIEIRFDDYFENKQIGTRERLLGKPTPIYEHIYKGVSLFISISW